MPTQLTVLYDHILVAVDQAQNSGPDRQIWVAPAFAVILVARCGALNRATIESSCR